MTRLWRTSPPLTAVAMVMLVAFGAFVAGIVLDPRVITGVPAWLKPAKFAISTAIYSLTLAWVFGSLPTWRRTRAIAGWTTAIVFAIEVAIIAVQAWRGTTSHFNVSTVLDGVLFGVMGTLIIVQTAASAAVATALWRERVFEDRAIGWALRLGMTLTIVGAATGGLMTRPTAAQLEQPRTAHVMMVAGAHTVGAPDGGPGLPATGWSTEHGDLRVPHFVGLHALQVLPLFVIALRRRGWPESLRVRAAVWAGVAYSGLYVALLVQALRGQPVLQPGAMTPDQIFSIVNLVALAGWVLLAVLPGRAWVTSLITTAVIPALLAATYIVVLGLHWGDTDGGFGSLSQVATLFTSRWALLAGWTHYLAFDLLVGSWEARDARAHGIPHWLVLPCLFLTFMFGPAGWLLYMTVRAMRGRVLATA